MGGSPPLGPKPRSAVPSHLLNGGSQLHKSASVRDASERDNLNSSIRSSFSSRKPIEFDTDKDRAGVRYVISHSMLQRMQSMRLTIVNSSQTSFPRWPRR